MASLTPKSASLNYDISIQPFVMASLTPKSASLNYDISIQPFVMASLTPKSASLNYDISIQPFVMASLTPNTQWRWRFWHPSKSLGEVDPPVVSEVAGLVFS